MLISDMICYRIDLKGKFYIGVNLSFRFVLLFLLEL